MLDVLKKMGSLESDLLQLEFISKLISL